MSAAEVTSDAPAAAPGTGRRPYKARRRSCPLSGKAAPKVDYKNVRLLSQYVSDGGKIVPNRISGVCAGKQRELATAIKRARFLALMPYVVY
jgi:small subunit ribosomal protein S18